DLPTPHRRPDHHPGGRLTYIGDSTAASSTCAAPPSDSATSPTTSPDHCSRPAASGTDYTLNCEEPLCDARAGPPPTGESRPHRRCDHRRGGAVHRRHAPDPRRLIRTDQHALSTPTRPADPTRVPARPLTQASCDEVELWSRVRLTRRSGSRVAPA